MSDDNAAIKDPGDWVTGDEPETAAQRSYLETLSREAGEEPPGAADEGRRGQAHRRAAGTHRTGAVTRSYAA
jgi:hypothetical protein